MNVCKGLRHLYASVHLYEQHVFWVPALCKVLHKDISVKASVCKDLTIANKQTGTMMGYFSVLIHLINPHCDGLRWVSLQM